MFTAYHRGHVEFYVCDSPSELTQDCFNQRPLHFDESIDYYDPLHPERFYLDPYHGTAARSAVIQVTGLKIPSDLRCSRCVLQFFYVTANSCLPPDYDKAPDGAVGNLNLPSCVFPYDTTGVDQPERFWNCADIAVTADGPPLSPTPPENSPTPAPENGPAAPAPTAPANAPTVGAPPTGGNACVTSGSCNPDTGFWDGCDPWGDQGPCKNLDNSVCYTLPPDGNCPAGTTDCRSSATGTDCEETSPTVAVSPTAPPESQSPTTAPSTCETNVCNPATGIWDSCDPWGEQGPCKNLANSVCYRLPIDGVCPAGTTDCRGECETSGGSPTPAPTIQAPTTQAPSPGPTVQAPTTDAPSPVPTTASPTEPQPTFVNPDGRKFVMYYESWATYDRNFQVSDIDASTITHINYGFADVQNGRCVLGDSYADTEKSFPGDKWDDPLRGNFNQLLQLKAAQPHLRTLISVGGWTWSSGFSAAAATEASRQVFAESCVDFMLAYGFDGVDIDWEFPYKGGLQPSNNPADVENYTLLLKALRDRLDALEQDGHERKLLTIATSPNPEYIDYLQVAELDNVLDWINIMTYDYNGAWQSTAAHNAPLYPNTSPLNPQPDFSVDATVQLFLERGLSRAKTVVGMPTYGRGWRNIPAGDNHGLFSSCPGNCPSQGTWEQGVLDYKDVKQNKLGQAGWQRYWDDASKVPYLYNAGSGVFISYDDAESICYKSNYVMEQGLGGAMVWAASSDDNYELQQVIFSRVIDDQACAARRRSGMRKMLGST